MKNLNLFWFMLLVDSIQLIRFENWSNLGTKRGEGGGHPVFYIIRFWSFGLSLGLFQKLKIYLLWLNSDRISHEQNESSTKISI
jgi:hypothetical protein